ncbi:gag/pol/env polyprotein, putative [Perkinsus marinus ATCC 50983]|uniref:Gag/pol/env polyprotein, putative n=1 Tax=Perkinsus marinus (strain ATCC 50983 / TXsc) TaxID=423536 RepID=C5LI53_PERM5|nr:gag/pol/env polyprotein, putative [Perkinsus marinus ATCC 50983]EER03588.1 gag/pol/env polyprotein, putative [Perkinsus marinus ATCC 50983]|eukprot:XP_002771772.1 gag/pol/env polyprotein, putative [Perkinsus marinus ATCC 50983]
MANWNEQIWLKIRSTAHLAHLAAPMFIMWLTHIVPLTVSRRIQERCLENLTDLTAWRDISIPEPGNSAGEQLMGTLVGSWLKKCNEVLTAVVSRIDADLRVSDKSELLRRWCNVYPKDGESWSEFVSKEKSFHSQLEQFSDGSWEIRRDKLIRALKAYPFFNNDLAKLQYFPKLRESKSSSAFFDHLSVLEKDHYPRDIDDLLGLPLDRQSKKGGSSRRGQEGVKPSTPSSTLAGGGANTTQATTANGQSSTPTPTNTSKGAMPQAGLSSTGPKGPCRNCGKTGHWAKSCKAPWKKSNPKVSEGSGKESTTKLDQKAEEKKEVSYALAEGAAKPHPGWTTTTVEVLNHDSGTTKLKAALDTCSSVNLCSQKAIEDLRSSTIDLGVNSITVKSLGGCTKLDRMAVIQVIANNKTVDGRFYILPDRLVPGQQFDILLGKSTLHQLGYRLVNVNDDVIQDSDALPRSPHLSAELNCAPDEDLVSYYLWAEGIIDKYDFFKERPFGGPIEEDLSKNDDNDESSPVESTWTSQVDPNPSVVEKTRSGSLDSFIKYSVPVPKVKPGDDDIDVMVQRGVDYMIRHLKDWVPAKGNKWYRCRIRPVTSPDEKETDCPKQTHCFEFDWISGHPQTVEPRPSHTHDYSGALLEPLSSESKAAFHKELQTYIKRGWWQERSREDRSPYGEIVVFPVSQENHPGHKIRPCADCRRRNFFFPAAGYYNLSLSDNITAILASDLKCLRVKDISKAFYRLHLPRERELHLCSSGLSFRSSRVVFGVRFGPLALACFTDHFTSAVYTALTGVDPPETLTPEERCRYIDGLLMLCYYDDFILGGKDPRLLETVSTLMDRIGERFGVTFPNEKAATLGPTDSEIPSKHLGLLWYFKDGRLCAACPEVPQEEHDAELNKVLTKRRLFKICGLYTDPLGVHAERSLITNEIRRWCGVFGEAKDRKSWDIPLPLTERDTYTIKNLLSKVRELSSVCEHPSWGDCASVVVHADAAEESFGWTIGTENGHIISEKSQRFPSGLRWHTNRREMFALIDALKKALRIVELGAAVSRVLLHSDNMSAVRWCETHIAKLRGFDKLALRRLLGQFGEAEGILTARGVEVHTLHIPGSSNIRADFLSRYPSTLTLPTPIGHDKPAVFLLNEDSEDVEGDSMLTTDFIQCCARTLINDSTKWRGLELRRLVTIPEDQRKLNELNASDLYFHSFDGNLYFNDVEYGGRLYVPFEKDVPWEDRLRTKILGKTHWHHTPLKFIIGRLQEQVWWPSLKSDVKGFMMKCWICRREAIRLLPLGGQRPHSVSPRFQRVVIDFLGPFQGVVVENWDSPSILVAVDATTSWLELYLVGDQTANSTIKCLVQWSLRFGPPLQILSDQDPAYTSRVMKGVLAAFNITSQTSGGHHAQAQGAAEQCVHVVKMGIRKLCSHIPIGMALRNIAWVARIHNTTALYDETITPEELVYGGKTRDCVQALLEADQPTPDIGDAARFLSDLRQDVSALERYWRRAILEHRVGNLVDRPRRSERVEVDDSVFRVIVDGLKKRRVGGPFTVSDINEAGTMATIEGPHGSKEVPTWQLFKAPPTSLARLYGDFDVPEMQEARERSEDELSPGDLIVFRSVFNDEDDDGTIGIDFGKFLSRDGDNLYVQRLFVDDKGCWHDRRGQDDEDIYEVEIRTSDVLCSGPDVKLTQAGRPTKKLKDLLGTLGVSGI